MMPAILYRCIDYGVQYVIHDYCYPTCILKRMIEVVYDLDHMKLSFSPKNDNNFNLVLLTLKSKFSFPKRLDHLLMYPFRLVSDTS